MDSDFLSKYYDLERNHWWFRVREKIILQQLHKSLPESVPVSILNVGVATGKTTEMMEPFGRVISVEVDHKTCQFLKEKLKMDVVEASVTSLPFADECFDVICVFDVLEHVEKDEQAILELRRVCKTGGVIFLTVPAFSFLWSDHDVINHHFRRYTSRRLKNLFASGFQVSYLTYFNFILFFPIACFRALRKISLSRKFPQSDFAHEGFLSSKGLNSLFAGLFNMEVFFLRYMRFPFGVSILASMVKK